MLELFILNRYELEITCADPMYVITRLSEAGVRMRDIIPVEQWKIKFTVSGRHLRTVQSQAKQLGCDVRIVVQKGPSILLRILKKRVVLISGLMFLTVLTLYIPTRVLFIEVEGNNSLDTAQILEKAEQVGISFGASRKSVRSEKMKNALLEAAPQLKWAGINTYGCRAVISVVERDKADAPASDNGSVQGIYAIRDGVVSSITVTKGTALCKPGEVIGAGQLLISGYTDCGLITRAECAEGEVYALTQHKIHAVIPVLDSYHREVKEKKTRWSIQLGKKQIKLYIDSGNFGTGCGKIYKSLDLTLPGGFRLPLSLTKETVFTYQYTPTSMVENSDIANALAEEYICNSMIAGKILRADFAFEKQEGLCRFSGVYACEEMVGKLQNEEIK